jgi:hypothetical protein
VGVVLMVVGIAGVVISLVLASTARRTDVVLHTTSGDYVDPPRGDDPRLGRSRLAVPPLTGIERVCDPAAPYLRRYRRVRGHMAAAGQPAGGPCERREEISYRSCSSWP